MPHDTIYIKTVVVIGDVETETSLRLLDVVDNVVEDLNINQLKMYMNVSGTVNLLAGGSVNSKHHVKANGNASINLDAVPEGAEVHLMLEQDATGGRVFTLPTFDNLDTQPTITTVANKMDVLIIMKMSGKIHLHSFVPHTQTY